MKKIITLLRLRYVGLLEMLIASYPIMTVYHYPNLPFSLLFLIIMLFLAFNKKRNCQYCCDNRVLKYLCVFVLVHEIILSFFIGVNGLFINKIFEYIIIFTSVIYIYPKVNLLKLEGSINWISIICILGLLYHFVLLLSGGEIEQLKIPFFPDMEKDAKIYLAMSRPRSFFNEPQHYCSFMLVPLFFSLLRKESLIWSMIILISIFLSTSSYGIIASLIMFLVSILSKKMSLMRRIATVLIGCSVVIFLFSSNIFEKSIDKIQNTEIERSSRLYNGPTLLYNMPKMDLVLGVPFFTVADYYFSGATGRAYLIEKNDNIYLPSFYLIFIKFGIIGLILYLLSYFKPMMKVKELFCIGVPLFAGLFSNPDALGSSYAFYMIIIYTIASQLKKTNY